MLTNQSIPRFGFVVALALILTGTASADSKVYPGSNCQASGSGQDLFYSGVIAANRQNSTESAVCPFVRDKINKKGWKRVAVFVRDRHDSQNICCFARARDPFGTAGTGSQTVTKCTTDGGGELQSLTFDQLAAGSTPKWGSYALVCSLPPMQLVNQPSYIGSYRIVE